MSLDLATHQKIKADHLMRTAYLYVRQSTVRQVLENTESTRRQYALRQRAVALGWQDDHIVVIDSDLGQSGAATDRKGFQKLVAEVGMGRAGIVLGLEVSRLARNSTDWHRLLEICALTDTLILDEDGIYDPAHFNDRLLLGLKGTMSEAELHVLRARLRGGALNKARRGEFRLNLPVGLVYDSDHRVVLDPDKQVQETLHLFFKTFAKIGSVSATIRHFRKEGLLFPSRVQKGARKGELLWGPLSLGRAASALHNPFYAGAYAYGRTRTRTLPEGRTRCQRLPISEWHALIRDAHPGYITWEEYERNERLLAASAEALQRKTRRAPPREGQALLQGRVVCGLCGRRMHIEYCVRRRGPNVPRYVCPGRGRLYGDPSCQSVVGTTIDAAVGELVVETVTPMALELALAVQEEIRERLDEVDRLRHRQVERTQYEADQARHRYMQVDPANRLVADSLEADWNQKLRFLAEAREEYERECEAARLTVSEQQKEQVLAIASDFPTVWSDPATPPRERKRMLALIIEDVTIVKKHQLTAAIRFRGGATTTLTLPRPLTAWELRATNEDVRGQMDALLNEYTDAETANILNERGLRTGAGSTFDTTSVKWVRYATKLRSLKDRLLEAGWLTGRGMQARLGVSRNTLGRWRVDGRIEARICNEQGEWLYWPPDLPAPDSDAAQAKAEGT